MTEAPVLAYPNMTKKFVLDTDASGVGVGAVLSQVYDGNEGVIGYFSKLLSKTEQRYCVTRRELLAVVEAVKHFHNYLYGVPFEIRYDHGSLRWLLNFKNLEGQLGRWSELLGTYNFTLTYRASKQHTNADFLSHPPCVSCQYCERVVVGHCETIEECYHGEERNVLRNIVSRDNAFDRIDSWLEGKTSSALHKLQEEDPSLSVLVKKKVAGEDRPKWAELSSLDGDLKHYWSQWDRLLVKDNLLYRQWFGPSQTQPILQLVLPMCLRKEVLSLLHEQKCSGHFGIRRTIGRLQRWCYWAGYKQDVRDWCMKCEKCRKRNFPSKRPRAPLKQYPVGVPFERVGIDILGPLPESKRGNKYIVVIGDYFTKWIEAFGVPDMEAETVARVLMEGFIARFGLPKQIHSDQGSQFESKLFQSLCKLLGIDKTRTTSYHPQSNGFIERYNRTLENILSKLIDNEQRSWDDALPYAMMAYRSSVHELTNQSPAKMLLGREIQLPVDLLLGCPPDSVVFEGDVASYVEGLRDVLRNVHEYAREYMVEASEKQKRGYDHRTNYKSYKAGDSVFLFEPIRKKGICPKFESLWTGPWVILDKVSDLIYKIRKTAGSHPRYVHHDRLKPCYTPTETQATEIREAQQPLVCRETVQEVDPGMGLESELADIAPSNLGNEVGGEGQKQSSGVVTRSGRKVKTPCYLSDYA